MSQTLIFSIGFLIHFFYTRLTDRFSKGGSQSIYKVVVRVIGKNLNVFVWFVFGIILIVLVIVHFHTEADAAVKAERNPSPNGGGPQSEQFAEFGNFVTWPIQAAVEVLTFLLRTVVLGVAACHFFFKSFYVENTIFCTVLFLAIYLTWLVFTTHSVVLQEFADSAISHGVIVRHNKTEFVSCLDGLPDKYLQEFLQEGEVTVIQPPPPPPPPKQPDQWVHTILALAIFGAVIGTALWSVWDFLYPAYNYFVFHTPLPRHE